MIRRDFIGSLGCSALASLAACGCSSTTTNTRHLVATPDARADYLARMLKLLCADLGPHPSGTSAYDKAAEIIKADLEPALPHVEQDSYTFEKWEAVGEQVCRLGNREIEIWADHGSSTTPESGLKGIMIKPGSNAPYSLVDEKTGDMLANVRISSYGAAVPSFVGTKNIRCKPRVCIGRQDVDVMDAAVENKTQVFIKALSEFTPDVVSSNVIGRLPGKSSSEIIILAHADTVYSSPGANDNTASMLVMFMLAHAFSGTNPNLTITFAATGSEEYGLLGAYHYAERRKQEGTLGNIRYLVNYDSLTYGPDLQISTTDKGLKFMLEDIHTMPGIIGTPKFADRKGFVLDGLPFEESGARAINVNSRGYNEKTLHLWHSPLDMLATVHVDCVENSFLVFKEYIDRIMKMEA
ncbi:M28 family peptidase [Candidatus Latescibacterota bacterium]